MCDRESGCHSGSPPQWALPDCPRWNNPSLFPSRCALGLVFHLTGLHFNGNTTKFQTVAPEGRSKKLQKIAIIVRSGFSHRVWLKPIGSVRALPAAKLGS